MFSASVSFSGMSFLPSHSESMSQYSDFFQLPLALTWSRTVFQILATVSEVLLNKSTFQPTVLAPPSSPLFCVLQVCEKYQVVVITIVVPGFDIFVSSSCKSNINNLDHRKKLRNISLVGYTGHFDEIDFAVSEGLEGKKSPPTTLWGTVPVRSFRECHRETAEHQFFCRQ